MPIERYILTTVTIISIVSILYIPKNKYRLALISFLSFQAFTWAAVIILVQTNSVEFPVREFPKATKAGFLVDFIFLPAIYTWSVLLSPAAASIIKKIVHNLVFMSLMVWFINFISTYTQLQHFIRGTFISQTIQLYIEFIFNFTICNVYVSWFLKTEPIKAGG